ncbi:Uncharacterised protein [Metamycoplasma arthritidis]|uniref:Hypothetical lipoprotein n=1 Tax=Metamycoplasma arthritidis (strain 158L3-1) TaxID=243272 RepID=B3PM78_META1|nr:hypothetical protein [Metamycoplasma arthritidis]ACF07130.1 hypothetical lipoprotein [Metamycoplasma arthritidis 158L3-1]VEU78656.1 Uncharacterised protein [Metamycoplasma arthritidis]
MKNLSDNFLNFKKDFFEVTKDIDQVSIFLLASCNTGKIFHHPLNLNTKESTKNIAKLHHTLKEFQAGDSMEVKMFSRLTLPDENFWFEDEIYRIYIKESEKSSQKGDVLKSNLFFISIFNNGSIIFSIENNLLRLFNDDEYLRHLYEDYFILEVPGRKKNIFHRNEEHWDNLNVFSKFDTATKINFFKQDLLEKLKLENSQDNGYGYELIKVKKLIQSFLDHWNDKRKMFKKKISEQIMLNYYSLFTINSEAINDKLCLSLSKSNKIFKEDIHTFLAQLNDSKKYENVTNILKWEEYSKVDKNKNSASNNKIVDENKRFIFYYDLMNATLCSEHTNVELFTNADDLFKVTLSYFYYIHAMATFIDIFSNENNNRLITKGFYVIKNTRNALNYYSSTIKNYLENAANLNRELIKDIKQYIYRNSQIENKIANATVVANTIYSYLETKNEKAKAINNGILRFIILIFASLTAYNIIFHFIKDSVHVRLYNYIIIPILCLIIIIGALSAYRSSRSSKG